MEEITFDEIALVVLKRKAKLGERFDIDKYDMHILDIVEEVELKKKKQKLYVSSACIDGTVKYKEKLKYGEFRIFIGIWKKNKVIVTVHKDEII